MRLLIVDDSCEFLEAAKDVLTQQGLDVMAVASTGTEAARLIGELRLDVVLVDVDLGPERGIDVAAAIRSQDGPPVVLISAYSEAEVADLAGTGVAIGFISKPDLSAQRIIEVLDWPGSQA